jgi:hypothetical protein
VCSLVSRHGDDWRKAAEIPKACVLAAGEKKGSAGTRPGLITPPSGENEPPEALNAAGTRLITRTVSEYLLDGMPPLATVTGSRGLAANANPGSETGVTQQGAELQKRIPHGPESLSGVIRTAERCGRKSQKRGS